MDCWEDKLVYAGDKTPAEVGADCATGESVR